MLFEINMDAITTCSVISHARALLPYPKPFWRSLSGTTERNGGRFQGKKKIQDSFKKRGVDDHDQAFRCGLLAVPRALFFFFYNLVKEKKCLASKVRTIWLTLLLARCAVTKSKPKKSSYPTRSSPKWPIILLL